VVAPAQTRLGPAALLEYSEGETAGTAHASDGGPCSLLIWVGRKSCHQFNKDHDGSLRATLPVVDNQVPASVLVPYNPYCIEEVFAASRANNDTAPQTAMNLFIMPIDCSQLAAVEALFPCWKCFDLRGPRFL
jgi:hypothetical protein